MKPDADALPCPACGFFTMDEAYGSFVICSICGWEDDGVQLANPTSEGGANRESLLAAQLKALRSFPLDVSSAEGILRSQNWRPLEERDIALADSLKIERYWHSRAVYSEDEAYWKRDIGAEGSLL